MKKIIIILLLSILLLCSCEKKEYKLIELNGDELLEYLTNGKGDIAIAFTNELYDLNENFLVDLEKVVKNAKENIYYIDTNHLSLMNSLLIYEYFSTDLIGLNYFALEDGKQVVSGTYTGNFSTLMKDLNGKKYDTEINYTSEENIEAALNDIKKFNEVGFIGSALNSINYIWNNAEAKKIYNENRYYKIIDSWEWQEEKNNKIGYTSILFTLINDQVYIYSNSFKKEEFKKPGIEDYTPYYYKILNNKLLFSNSIDGEYKEFFNIDYLDKDTLVLSDKNNKKTFKIKEVGE